MVGNFGMELKEVLEDVVTLALQYCAVDASGKVHLKRHDLTGKERAKIVLSAKAIANQLDPSFAPDITVTDLARATGLVENQARARAADAVNEGFAEAPERGSYRANPFRVGQFLSELSKGSSKQDVAPSARAGVRPVPSQKTTATRESGTASRIMSLATEGFFAQPRSLPEIQEALAQRGWHYPQQNLSTPLRRMVQCRTLRRTRLSEGKKTLWKYSAY